MRSFAIVFLLLVTAWTAVSMRSAGIPLFCIGNGRLKSIRDNYNQGLGVSLARRPGAVQQVLRIDVYVLS